VTKADRRVREVAAGDRDALVQLLGDTPEFNEDERVVALELIDAAIAKSDDYCVLIAESDGRLDGYVCYGRTPMTEGTYDLYWIATAAHARRTGAGLALVAALEERLQAIHARLIRLETSSRPEYAPTRRFYEKAGFVMSAKLRDFYTRGDHLLVYLRTLGRPPRRS
jgi:ribosomal protein S18 acetylase RimI-like enzyme